MLATQGATTARTLSPFEAKEPTPPLRAHISGVGEPRRLPEAQRAPRHHRRPHDRRARVLPSGMAYAELPASRRVVGLYGLLLPAVAYTLLGSSWSADRRPEGALALLVATRSQCRRGTDRTQRCRHARGMVGVIAVVARVVCLGWIADYFSRAVLVGYLHGIVIVLIDGQLGSCSDCRSARATDPSCASSSTRSQTCMVDVVVGAVRSPWSSSCAGGRRVCTGTSRRGADGMHRCQRRSGWPTTVSRSLDTSRRAPEYHWPESVRLDDVGKLLRRAGDLRRRLRRRHPATARSFVGRNGQHVDANQEMLALGAANSCGRCDAGVPVGASGSRTAVNDQIGGARSSSGWSERR